MQEHPPASQFPVGLPAIMRIIPDVAESFQQKNLLYMGLLKKLPQCEKALCETAGIGNGELNALFFRYVYEFRRLLEISRSRRKFEYVESFFHRPLYVFVATVHTGCNKQAVELVLYYQLSVVIVCSASMFIGDFFNQVRVLISDGLDIEILESPCCFKQHPAALVQAKYCSF